MLKRRRYVEFATVVIAFIYVLTIAGCGGNASTTSSNSNGVTDASNDDNGGCWVAQEIESEFKHSSEFSTNDHYERDESGNITYYTVYLEGYKNMEDTYDHDEYGNVTRIKNDRFYVDPENLDTDHDLMWTTIEEYGQVERNDLGLMTRATIYEGETGDQSVVGTVALDYYDDGTLRRYERTEGLDQDHIPHTAIIEYEADGRIAKEGSFSADETDGSGKVKSYEYVLNNNNKPTLAVIASGWGNKEGLNLDGITDVEKRVYTYDENGNVSNMEIWECNSSDPNMTLPSEADAKLVETHAYRYVWIENPSACVLTESRRMREIY